jgi:hypothetical protein
MNHFYILRHFKGNNEERFIVSQIGARWNIIRLYIWKQMAYNAHATQVIWSPSQSNKKQGLWKATSLSQCIFSQRQNEWANVVTQ